MPDTAIRPAATIILARHGPDGPRILMGQRGEAASFMPSKFVFPGGAVDEADAHTPFARPPDTVTTALLTTPHGPSPKALCAAAIRELCEEAGLALALPGTTPGAPQGLAARGLLPDAGALSLIFRAITPPGRTRRFDARFLMADAAALTGDPDDFSAASDELAHLRWVPLDQARTLDLPFITRIVLAEVASLLGGHGQRGGVPFFDNSGDQPVFRRLI